MVIIDPDHVKKTEELYEAAWKFFNKEELSERQIDLIINVHEVYPVSMEMIKEALEKTGKDQNEG